MYRHFKIPALCLLLITLWSCQKGTFCNCDKGAGSPTEETRTLPYFEQVFINDNINVFISMGNTQQVSIQGGKNLIKYISTDVSGNVLTLKNNNKCNWLRSYKKSKINVYITVPRITYITNAGIGTVNSLDTITTDTLQVQTIGAGDINLTVRSKLIEGHLYGSSDLTLSGSTHDFLCNYFGGTGYIYCTNLNTVYTYMSSSTTGDCYVNSNTLLIAVINQRGNIYYTGNPSVSQTIKGQGKLIKE